MFNETDVKKSAAKKMYWDYQIQQCTCILQQ